MSYETLLVDQEDRVRRITLNRPEKLNALSSALLAELVDAVGEAERDRHTHVVVLRGAGKAFCSGHDVSPAGREADDQPRTMQRDLGDLLGVNEQLARAWNCRIPVIAEVHGYCIAGGSDLALHCDLLIAAEDAAIGYPPARYLGVPPTHMWLYAVGPQWAKRILFSGDTISGRTAAEIGLALEAVPAADLEERVLRHARHISQTGRDFLIGTKLVVNQGLELMGRSTLQTFAATQDAMAHVSPDALEFQKAIMEKGFAQAMADNNARFGDRLI